MRIKMIASYFANDCHFKIEKEIIDNNYIFYKKG